MMFMVDIHSVSPLYIFRVKTNGGTIMTNRDIVKGLKRNEK
jgi:hypothetical protein